MSDAMKNRGIEEMRSGEKEEGKMKDLKKEWADKIAPRLVGRRIVEVRYMTDDEMETIGWNCSPCVLVLDNGHQLYASRDDEGNDGGAMFTTMVDLSCLPVI